MKLKAVALRGHAFAMPRLAQSIPNAGMRCVCPPESEELETEAPELMRKHRLAKCIGYLGDRNLELVRSSVYRRNHLVQFQRVLPVWSDSPCYHDSL
jgi:hypothetical protein